MNFSLYHKVIYLFGMDKISYYVVLFNDLDD